MTSYTFNIGCEEIKYIWFVAGAVAWMFCRGLIQYVAERD